MAKKLRLFFAFAFFYFQIPPCMAADGIHERPRVAVIGGGGAGLTTAWLLDNDFNVTLFEIQDRLGGHADTVQVNLNGNIGEIDAGFEFFTGKMFPYYTNLLQIINAPVHKFPLNYTFYNTDSNDALVLPPISNGEISWDSFTPHHLFDLAQFKILVDEAAKIVDRKDLSCTLEQFFDGAYLTSAFKNEFLYPFFGGAWGIAPEEVKTFMAYDLMKWIVRNQPSGVGALYWNEVEGGTQAYIKAIAAQLTQTKVKLSSKITSIAYVNSLYTITEADGSLTTFNHLVLATNANQAAALLVDIPETLDIRTILNDVDYYYTTIAVHGDKRFMPPDQNDWSVANIRYDGVNSALTIYKPWKSETPIYRSWITYNVLPYDQADNPMPEPLYAITHYYHPKLNAKYFEAQKTIETVQGNNNLWFAGMYTYDIDSHESAITSAIRIAEKLAPQSDRLRQLTTLN